MYKLGKTIAEIGNSETQNPPVLVGVAEIENQQVMEGLLATEHLANIKYDYVHYDSPDERGIDCGLIYHKDRF
ncbi:endonuclease/exonuclease/phosphatase family protein [Zobellia nedashkovskayae]